MRAKLWEDVFGQLFAACMELPELGASPNKGHEGHRGFPHKGLFLTPRDFGAFQFLTWPGVLKPGQYNLYQWLSLDLFQWEQSGLPLIWVCFRLFKQYQLPMSHFQLQFFFFFKFTFEPALLILWDIYSLHFGLLCAVCSAHVKFSIDTSLDCFHDFPVVIFMFFSILFIKLGTSFAVALGSLIYPLSDPFSSLDTTITFESIKLSTEAVVYWGRKYF